MSDGEKRQAITPVDLITAINPFSTVAEQYRKIRTNIEFSSADKKIKSLVVTSSGPQKENNDRIKSCGGIC